MESHFKILNTQIHDQFTMVQAKEKDIEKVLALLIATAKWFQSKGSTQWSGLLEGIDTHNTKAAVNRGNIFVCKDDEEIAGMVMLRQTPSEWDCKLWELNESDLNESIYLHRLAINREYANAELGKAMLNWCQNNIIFEGKERLRLDCIASNTFLNVFYQNSGFTYIGENDGYSLFEYGF